MVKYMTMKRITQLLASILFVITILTVYFAFDFALSTAASQRNPSHKRAAQEHLQAVTKITRRRSITLPVPHPASKHDPSLLHEDSHGNLKRVMPNPKVQLRAKPGAFHKGKTGVKVNKPLKSLKGPQKRLPTTTSVFQRRDKPHK